MKNFNQFINEGKKHINKYDLDQVKNNFPPTLNHGEMVDFISDNNLRDSFGELDYNDAKEIAYATENNWVLTLIDTKDVCDWIFEKPYKTDINIPPIVLKWESGEYEVLDGKTRLGYLNYIGIDKVYVYLGE